MKKIISSLRTNAFLKGSVIMFSGTMAANVMAYLYHLVVGRMLGPEGYGELAALISIFYILNAPSLVVQNILVKFFSQLKAKEDYGQAKRLMFRITKLLAVVSGVLFVLLVPFISKMAEFLHITSALNLVWLYLMFAAFLFSVINLSVLQGFQLFLPITVISTLGGVLRLGFGALGALFGVGWALLANAIAGIAGYIATFIPLSKLIKQKESVIRISPMSALYYSIPALISVCSITALYSQDVVLVKHFFSSEEAGLYSSLSVLGKIIFFASSSLGAVAFPMLAEKKELGKPYGTIVAMAIGIVALISVGITFFYWMFPEFVVTILFGNAFTQASNYLASFGVFISLFTLSYLLTTIYLAIGKTLVWIPTGIAALLQVVITNMNHATLSVVIWNNTLIVGGLFIVLLLYYPYATRRT
jgi:O-antigen/teichoic acid export membrane protein